MAPWLGPGGHVGWPANHAPQAAAWQLLGPVQGVVARDPEWVSVPPVRAHRAILANVGSAPGRAVQLQWADS